MLILLAGYSRSGKDAIAAHLPGTRLAFADAMKELYCVAAGITMAELEANKEAHRPRLVEFGRKGRAISSMMWITPVLTQMEALWAELDVKITDTRYLNECYAMQNFGKKYDDACHIFFIERPGVSARNDEERDSIAELRRVLKPVVVVNSGTPEQAAAKIMEALKGTVTR